MNVSVREKRKCTRKRRVALSTWCIFSLCASKLVQVLVQRVCSSATPDFVVIGFYDGKLSCDALMSSVLSDVDVHPVDISKYRGVSEDVKRRNAIRDWIGRASGHRRARSFGRDTIFLSIDLTTVSLRARLKTLRGVSSEMYEQLRRGSVFVPSYPTSTSNSLGLLKYIRKTRQTHTLDLQHDIFCPSYAVDGCPRALVVTDENALPQTNKLDSTVMLELRSEIERRYKKEVRTCLNITARMGEQRNATKKLIDHFQIDSEFDGPYDSSMHSRSETERTSVDFVRVKAWTGDSIARLLQSQNVFMPRSLESNFSSEFLRLVACTVSHLTAIYMAYSAGVHHALVTEDGVVLPNGFKARLESVLSEAPNDWETLQLMVVNPQVANAVTNLYATHYIKWYPTHNSSAAYIISRRGMAKVLHRWEVKSRVSHFHSQPSLEWVFPTDGVYRTDESIFFPTRSYTYTRANFIRESRAATSLARDITIQTDVVSARNRPNFRMLAPDSIIMISNVRVRRVADFNQTIALLLKNFREVRKSVRLVSLRVNVVCLNHVIAQDVRRQLSHEIGQTDQLFVSVSVNRLRFNKFMFVAEEIPSFRSFERVMLLDSDMDFIGFPFMEYFELTASYIVCGTVHQNIRDMLSMNRDKPSRQWYKIFEGSWWERHAPHALLVESTFIEQGFTLLDATFAEWYFTKILTHRHLYYTDRDDMQRRSRESDYGPDLLWCGAAAVWLKNHNILSRSKPCAFTTFPVHHTDDRQLGFEETREPQAVQLYTRIQSQSIQRFKESFPQWFAYSHHFRRTVDGHVRSEDPLVRHLLDHSVRCIRCM